MNKKLMFWIMLANTVSIIIPLLILIFSGRMILPVLVLVMSGLLALAGLILSVRGFVLKGSRVYQLILYHCGVILVSAVNLLKMNSFPMELNFLEILVIGSLVHIFVSFFLLYLTFRQYSRVMRKARFITQGKKRRAKIVPTVKLR